MGARLDRYEDRIEELISDLEKRQTIVKSELAEKRMFLDDLMEKEAGVQIMESSIDRFRERLPNVTDSEWRQLLLDLGLTAQIKPNDKADVRISVRFSEVIKRRIEQPSLQPGQILGGVVSLRS